jgi:hypothetical protein
MAVTALSMLLLAQQYRQDLVRQANRRAVTLSVLRKVLGAGKNVPIPFELSGQTASAYVEGADMGTPTPDTQVGGVLSWGLYQAPIGLTNLAADAAGSTSAGPDGNQDAWARQIVNGTAALCSLLNTDLYQGDGSGSGGEPTIVGFETAIAATSGTYGGLDRGTYTLLQPNVTDPGAAMDLSVDLIRADLAPCYTRGGSRPDLAFCVPAVFNKVAGMLDPQRRLETETIQAAGSPVNLAYKVSTVNIDGCTFIEDKDASFSTDSSSVGSIVYINSDYVEIELLMPGLNRSAYAGLAGKGLVSLDDGMTKLAASAYYEPMAKTGAAFKARVAITAQLKCLRPNAMGVRRNIKLT